MPIQFPSLTVTGLTTRKLTFPKNNKDNVIKHTNTPTHLTCSSWPQKNIKYKKNIIYKIKDKVTPDAAQMPRQRTGNGEDILGIQTDTAKCPAVFLVEESRKSYDKGSRKETTDPLGEELKTVRHQIYWSDSFPHENC